MDIRLLSVLTAAIWLAYAPLAASQDVTTPRPELSPTPTPFVIGGLRVDMGQLSSTAGVIRRGGDILSGPARHARTAVVAQASVRPGLLGTGLTVPSGAPLHQVEFVQRVTPTASVTARLWCGPMGGQPSFVNRDPVYCISEEDGSLRAWLVRGAGWLATSSQIGVESHWLNRLEITPTEPDPQSGISVIVRLSQVTRQDIFLRMFARRGDQELHVLSVRRPIEQGAAVVPFWTHRLILTVADRGVTARLTPDGDGSGPAEIGEYPTL